MKLNRIKNLMPAPKDAQGLYLVVSPEKLLLSESGSFKGSDGQISVEVWKRKGDDDPTQENMGEYSVYIFKNGSTTASALKKNTPSFTYAASKNDTTIDIKLKVKDSFVDTVTVTVTSNGVGISGADVVFCVSISGTEAPADNSDWKTKVTDLGLNSTIASYYIWQATKVTYTTGTSAYTGKICLGQVKDFASITEQYSLGTASASGGTWQDTTPPAATKGKYLWTRTKLTYNNGSVGYSPSEAGVCIGYWGTDGVGISSADVVFCVSTSGTTAPADNSTWKTTVADLDLNATIASYYLWQATKVTYTSGSPAYTGKICLGQVKDFASVTEQYSLGTASASSGTWQDTTPPAAVKGKYLWTRTKLTYSNGSVGYSPSEAGICTGYFGTDGDSIQGNEGNGITDHKTYYLATTMATGVTRSTDASSWTENYQMASADKPFVWRYEVTCYRDTPPSYTDCELIFTYSAGANQNLLEQTNFSSLQAMDKWVTRSIISFKDGVSVVESYGSITTGIQAHNAYYDRTYLTTSQINCKEVLRQVLMSADGEIKKLENSTWYTLSFWAKGDGCTSYFYPSCFDSASPCYIDGEYKAPGTRGSDANIDWTFDGTWKQHTFTFKTKSSIGAVEQSILFRLQPKASSTASNSVYICMPKLEVGMQATGYQSNEGTLHKGQLRRRRWAINTEYLAGGVDEPYEDVVLASGHYYRCIKSHISDLDNRPGTGSNALQYWSNAQAGEFEMLSTDLFLATKAYIENLVASLIQTGYEGTPHIEAEGSEFKIFGKGQYPAIFLAVNSDNKAVLRFQNENTGEFLYDLGPDGIMKEFSEVADSYSEIQLHKLTNVKRVSEVLDIGDSDCTTYYRFNEGYKKIGSGTSATKEYHISGTSTPSAKNSAYFTSKNYNGTQIADGWYCRKNNGNYIQQLTDETYVNDDGLTDNKIIYEVNIMNFASGKLVQTARVFFQYTDYQHASKSVGCDMNGNELSTSTYTYLYSYWQQNNIITL